MKETRILFASLLKPCNDVRWEERLAAAFAHLTPHAKLYSAGPYASGSIANFWTECKGLFVYSRIPSRRTVYVWKVLRFSFKVKPSIIIVNCPELLYVAITNKILFGTKIVYDVQENFVLNAANAHTSHPAFKGIGSLVFLFTEWLCVPFIHRCWLAEEVYAKQMPRKTKKGCILPNVPYRSVDISPRKRRERLQIGLLTGTISKRFGVYTALEWVKQLRERNPFFCLTILGHCPDAAIARDLQQVAELQPWIQLKISAMPIPNSTIKRAIAASDILLMPYGDFEEIQGKVPSKVWEAILFGTPCILPLSMQNTIPMLAFEDCPEAGICTLTPDDLKDQQVLWKAVFEQELCYLGMFK
jgi:glycosyltransferase involved in cell wall biosynthesis